MMGTDDSVVFGVFPAVFRRSMYKMGLSKCKSFVTDFAGFVFITIGDAWCDSASEH